MQNKKTLLLFPLITQLIFSLIAGLLSDFSLQTFKLVFITTAVPAFLLALVCVYFNYHHKHLLPLGFFSGVIGFFYSLILIIYDTTAQASVENNSLIEDSIMVILFALSYALPAIIYALIVLRPFLRKR